MRPAKDHQDNLHAIELSRTRHFRLTNEAKLIIGRDEAENETSGGIFQQGIMLEAEDYTESWVLLPKA